MEEKHLASTTPDLELLAILHHCPFVVLVTDVVER
jgi:hypothetical protein